MTEEQASALLQKYTQGLCTPGEEQAIIKWADTLGATPHAAWTEQEKAVFTGLLDKRISALTGVDMQSAAMKPVMSVSDIQPPARRKLLWLRYAAAAAILVAVITTVIVMYADRKPHSGSPGVARNSAQDVLPGHAGAVLTLADGKKIVLDSMGNGAVARQGKTMVLIKNGRLEYAAGGPDELVLTNTMTTPKGRQYQLVLPDGTRVWLNAASSITYPAAFSGKERTVAITGEAYFEVAKNKEKPFIVDVDGRSTVHVLGTSFNINSYADEDNIKTTLLEGSVKVSGPSGTVDPKTNTVLLKPGQQAQVQPGSTAGIAIKHDPDIEEVMAWKGGYFQFNEASLSSVLKQLTRWYNVEVVFEGTPPAKTFIGEIPRDATLLQVLTVLEKTGVHFRIDGRRIVVTQ